MLTVIATIKAKPESAADVQNQLLKLIEPTRKESGCLRYELNVDNDDTSLFVFVEQWESEQHLTAHLAGEKLKSIIAGIEPLVEFIDVAKMTDISG